MYSRGKGETLVHNRENKTITLVLTKGKVGAGEHWWLVR